MPKNNYSEALKMIDQIEPSPGLHQKIMRRVWFIKLRRPALVIGVLLIINFMLILWRLWVRLTEFQGYYVIQTVLETMEWEGASVSFAASEIAKTLPVNLIISLIINLALLRYAYHIFGLIKKNVTKVERHNFNH